MHQASEFDHEVGHEVGHEVDEEAAGAAWVGLVHLAQVGVVDHPACRVVAACLGVAVVEEGFQDLA
jgi:hypothetical protein